MSDRTIVALAALGEGGRTGAAARRLGWKTPQARAALKRLGRDGRVMRDPRFTYENAISWRAVAHG